MDRIDIYTTRTLDSGVRPIEVRFSPIYDCYYGRMIGFRGKTCINSILYGSLEPSRYLPALDAEGDETGLLLAKYGIRRTLRDLCHENDLAGIEFVTLQVSSSVLFGEGLYDALKQAAEGRDIALLRRIYLEFGEEVLTLGEEQVARAFSDIRAAGFRVAIRGYVNRFFPMGELVHLTPDAVFLDRETVALLDSRERSAVVPSFIRFAASLDVRVIAEGVPDDGHLRELNSAECAAFLPDPGYHGALLCSTEEKELVPWLTERRESVRGGE